LRHTQSIVNRRRAVHNAADAECDRQATDTGRLLTTLGDDRLSEVILSSEAQVGEKLQRELRLFLKISLLKFRICLINILQLQRL